MKEKNNIQKAAFFVVVGLFGLLCGFVGVYVLMPITTHQTTLQQERSGISLYLDENVERVICWWPDGARTYRYTPNNKPWVLMLPLGVTRCEFKNRDGLAYRARDGKTCFVKKGETIFCVKDIDSVWIDRQGNVWHTDTDGNGTDGVIISVPNWEWGSDADSGAIYRERPDVLYQEGLK